MPDEMEEIIAEFITESQETLDKVDPLFIELEARGGDKEILNNLFRIVHTIKGAAGFLGFQTMVEVAHNAESIMKKLREGEIALTRQLVDVVLKSIDMLRLLLRHIKDKDGVQEDVAPLVHELKLTLETAQPVKKDGFAQEAGEESRKTGAESHKTDAESSPVHSEPVTPAPESRMQNTGPTAVLETVAGPESAAPPEKKETQQTLRVEVDKIDKVMDLTGEVVLVRNRLLNIMGRLEQSYSDDQNVQSLLEAVSFLDLITSDMQLGVMKMRMQPIAKVFSKFPRLVRDIAGPLGKSVELRVAGEDTEVDKSVIEEIGDPMVHIIRNSVDHGIETPRERLAKGKPEKGTISISAEQKGNQIVIEVSDDGRGINIEKVKLKALEKGLVTADEAARMTEQAAINILFLPGFSTAEVATKLSGRGVGLDVVKTNISKLHGTVEVTTRRDAGTTFTIRLPLTLAIIQTLMVRAGGARYAVPLAPVEETLTVSKSDISDMGGTKALLIRGNVYPLFGLSGIIGAAAGADAEYKYAVVVAIGEKHFCLGVDELLGQEEVVIKTLTGINTSSSYILGATITGDGRVVFILDLAAISKNALDYAKA